MTTTTTYVYNGPQILAEYEGGVLARKFIYGPGIDEPLAMIIPSGGNAGTYWYFYDGLGSVVALVNGSTGAIVERYVYDAFGNTWIYDAGFNTPPRTQSLYGNPFRKPRKPGKPGENRGQSPINESEIGDCP